MERTSPRACILAVGTELTSGEITNRNSTWISARLQAIGIEVVLHETVPDSRPLILSALRHCEEQGELIFVTGGLGPTTDDFTREVIAQWCGKPLYPEGAKVLLNAQGTANGFLLEKPPALAWILPGPPNELEAIWNAAPPGREIAARFPALKSAVLARLEAATEPGLVARDDEDLAANLLRALGRDQEIELLDAASGGLLAERLGPLLRKPEFSQQAESLVLATEWISHTSPDDWLSAVLAQADEQAITLALAGPDRDGDFRIGLKMGSMLHQETLRTQDKSERGRRYAIELALKIWRQWLNQSVN